MKRHVLRGFPGAEPPRIRPNAGRRAGLALLFAGLLPLAGRAQWIEQTIPLAEGWNAVHLKVNPAETACSAVFADGKVTQVAWWNRDRLDDGTGSAVTDFCNWYRNSAEPSTFGRVIGDKRYLVKASAATTLKVKGTPAIPSGRLYRGEMNLVGVNAPSAPAGDRPLYHEYFTPLAPVPELYEVTAANASRRILGTQAVADPSKAVWFAAPGEGEATYMGPFEVSVDGGAVMAWTLAPATRTLTVKNVSPEARAVRIAREPSLAPPAGQGTCCGDVALARETIDWSAGYAQRAYVPVSFPFVTNLAAGATFEFRVRPDLDRMPAVAADGAAYQSVLAISDAGSVLNGETRAAGTCLYRVGVRAAGGLAAGEVNPAGLWVGTVALGQVNRAKMLGSAQPEWEPESLMDAPHPFQFRLIVHVAADGTTKILKQVFTAEKAADADGSDLLTDRDTAILYRALYPDATIRRTASANFPFIEPLALTGGEFMAPGAAMSATFTQAYDDRTNPFVHAFHPQHDNLEFRNKTPRVKASGDEGVGDYESWSVTRQVTLTFRESDPSAAAGASWNRTVTGGEYTERVTGLIGQGKPIVTRGIFRLSKVNDCATLTSEVIH